MHSYFNNEMLVLAREARGISQLQLADTIGMSATNLSKIERADIGMANETLEKIAEATSYPLQFFHQQGRTVPENLIYRKRQVVAQKLMTPIHAQANILRLQAQQLENFLHIPSFDNPFGQVAKLETPNAIASALRSEWKVEGPIIDNLTRLIESKGIITAQFDFGTARIDSKSIFTDAKRPIIITNKALTGCRQRFSLAYELGHLCMHNGMALDANRDIVHEANLFAAELLMPETAIREDFEKGIGIPQLAALKTKWKVSMIALLYRADDLGYLSPNQKRYLLQQFNALKIRRREPLELDIDPEQPQLMKLWIAEAKTTLQLGTTEIAALLCMDLNEFMEQFT
jgi:Zn-dependent peptidase ImmA (M78 family)/DNA-binding Xre family transcriptional regulator